MAPKKKKPVPNHLHIHPARYKLLLSSVREIPYTVYTQRPFDVNKKVTNLDLNPDNADKRRILAPEDQLQMWTECAKSVSGDPECAPGWTAIFAGSTHIAYGECLAAYLCAKAIDAGRNVLWVDIGEALGKRAFSIQDLITARQEGLAVFHSLIVVTGLRATSADTKWDRAFDILRTSSPGASRVIVAAGLSPWEASQKIGLPAQRMLHITSQSETVLA